LFLLNYIFSDQAGTALKQRDNRGGDLQNEFHNANESQNAQGFMRKL